jgi:hypothetical protein
MNDQQFIEQILEASLEKDYTVDHDCPEYADDAAARDAAVANVWEMHRLLGVRERRLYKAHQRIAKALSVAWEMRSQLVDGPELSDVLRVIAALTGDSDE